MRGDVGLSEAADPSLPKPSIGLFWVCNELSCGPMGAGMGPNVHISPV
jgi:hypothetical protein